jgi:hypothetical protein
MVIRFQLSTFLKSFNRKPKPRQIKKKKLQQSKSNGLICFIHTTDNEQVESNKIKSQTEQNNEKFSCTQQKT